MSTERDAGDAAAFDRMDKHLTELRTKIDEQLESFIRQGEILTRLLKEEREAQAEKKLHFMPPAHD
jgi:hypothetical protein